MSNETKTKDGSKIIRIVITAIETHNVRSRRRILGECRILGWTIGYPCWRGGYVF